MIATCHNGWQRSATSDRFSTMSRANSARAFFFVAGAATAAVALFCLGLFGENPAAAFIMFVSLPNADQQRNLASNNGVVAGGDLMREINQPQIILKNQTYLAFDSQQFSLSETHKTELSKPSKIKPLVRTKSAWKFFRSLPTINRTTLESVGPIKPHCTYIGVPPDRILKRKQKSNDTFESMADGCRIHGPTGMRLHKTTDVCIGRDRVALIARDDEEYAEMMRCCFGERPLTEADGCDPVVVGRCQVTIGKIGGTSLSVHLVNKSDVEFLNLTRIAGTSFLAHNPTLQEHFGHWINRLLQLFVVVHDKEMPPFPKIDQLVTRQHRLETLHLRTVGEVIMKDLPTKPYFQEDILQNPMQVVCLDRAYEPAGGQLEMTLFTEQQAELWREFSFQYFSPYGYTHTGECPVPQAAVLQRLEGTGQRRILNYDVIDAVFGRLGITYRNISVTNGDDSDVQVSLFNSFGLIVSSHSSQLKNLLWASKNTVVLETRSTPPGYMQPSPFSMGADVLGLIYSESVGHIPDYSSCPEDHGCRSIKMYKVDYWLNETIFEASVRSALAEQERRCPGLWQ